ncbi:MAG: helix-turn-helix transcriptional regulator [Clostridia bacterium]|nr:helix-turn-helix transcriptional regulator [Clostridia bacterium]
MAKRTENRFDVILEKVAAVGPEEAAVVKAATELSTLIESIVTARINAGLTQRQLAEKCGIKQSAIARMESLQAIPRVDTLIKIANCLNLSIRAETTVITNNRSNVVSILDYRNNKNTDSYLWRQENISINEVCAYGTIG